MSPTLVLTTTGSCRTLFKENRSSQGYVSWLLDILIAKADVEHLQLCDGSLGRPVCYVARSGIAPGACAINEEDLAPARLLPHNLNTRQNPFLCLTASNACPSTTW